MTPPVFLIGQHPDRGALWAAIEPAAHHVNASIADRRFAAYMAPFRSEAEARVALVAAGANAIAPEPKRVSKRG